MPHSLPPELYREASARNLKNGFHFFGNGSAYRAAANTWEELDDKAPELRRIEADRQNGYQMTPDQLVEYKQSVRKEFNYWANILNTRKLLSQPIIVTDDDDELIDALGDMNNAELLALFDDCTVSDGIIINRINSVNRFTYTEIDELSPAANDNLQRWFDNSHNAQLHYLGKSAHRTLVALYLSQEFRKRGQNYGDFIYSVRER